MTTEWLRIIKKMGACEEAVEWCKQFSTFEEAWAKCEHGDWMLWLLGKLSGEPGSDDRRKLVLVLCECARLALSYVREGEKRPLIAIETTEKWAKGEDNITLDDVKRAVHAAYAVHAAVHAAAHAAADATYATVHAVHAAVHTAYAATLKECADIVRAYYKAPEL